MKRFQRSVAMLLVMALLLPMLPVGTVATASTDFTYSQLEDGTISIDSYTGGDSHVTVPSEIDGLAVTQIAQEAFAYNGTVRSIVIPAGIASVGNSVFYRCTNLRAIAFLGTAPEFGFTAAEGCGNLEKIFCLSGSGIGAFCALLVNDLGSDGAAGVEVLEYGDVGSLQAAYNAYLTAPVQVVTEETTATEVSEEAAVAQSAEEPAEDAAGEAVATSTEAPTEDAAEGPQDQGPVLVSVDIPLQINPMYEGILSAEDFDLADPVPIQTFLDPADFSTPSEATAAIREAMKVRAEQLTVSVRTTETNHETLCSTVFHQALLHTGEPTEGDYLGFQYGGYKCNASWYVDSASNLYLDSEGYAYYILAFTITYYTTAEQEEAMDTAVSNLLSSYNNFGSTDYEKICGIYDYICNNVTYDYVNLENDSYKLKYSAYAALMNGTAVCQGYANLFYRLALEAGVDTRIIRGIGNGGAHAWNIVKLGNVYYNLDSTWDSARTTYAYFLKCNANFGDHTRDADYDSAFDASYPMSATDYSNPLEGEMGSVQPGDTSGTIGDNLTWSVEDGVLIISGNGEMEENLAGMPWAIAGHATTIHTVAIADGVTSISALAFHGHTSLSTVLLPDSLQTIGNTAFGDCTSLRSIILPAGVTSLGSYVFSGSGMMNVEFWGDLPALAEDTFAGVSTDASYPSGNAAWTESALTNYGGTVTWYPGGAPTATGLYGTIRWMMYGSYSLSLRGVGAMADKDSAAAYPWYEAANAVGYVNIASGITTLGDHAFAGYENLEGVSIGENVTEIGTGAFSGCAGITNIYFAGEAPTIAEDAFAGVTATVNYPGGYDTWNENTCVNYGGELTWVESLYILDEGTYGSVEWSLMSDGVLSLSGSNGETVSMEAAASETPYPWQQYQSQITSLYINNIRNIPASAFSGYTALESAYLNNGMEEVGERAFSGCVSLAAVNLASTVTQVGSNAFANCSALTTVMFQHCTPVIEENAFANVTAVAYYDCNAGWTADMLTNYGGTLTWRMTSFSRTLAEGTFVDLYWHLDQSGILCISGTGDMPVVASSGGHPWNAYADQIKWVYMDGLSSISNYAFYGFSNLTSLAIPATVTKIWDFAFVECSGLVNIRFLGATPELGEYAFNGISGATISYPYSCQDSWEAVVDQNYGGENLSWVCMVETLASGTMTSGVQWSVLETGRLVFHGEGTMDTMEPGAYPWNDFASRITDIHFGDLTSIGDHAFAGFTGLTNLTFGANLSSIGAEAFSGCTGVETISFEGTAPEIGDNAFAGITAQASYTSDKTWTEDVRQQYGGTITWVDPAAMASGIINENMVWNLDNGVLTISGSGSVPSYYSSPAPWSSYTEKITQVIVDTGVTGIGDYVFRSCPNLESVTLADTVRYIGMDAFSNNPKLMTLDLGEGVQSIFSSAFMDCTALTSVELPDSLESLGGDVFSGCTSLESVTISANMEMDSPYSYFWNCSSLTKVNVNGVSKYVCSVDGVLLSADETTLLFYPAGRTGAYTIPDTVTTVGMYAFRGTTGLTDITIPDSVTELGWNAFAGCTSLTKVVLPRSMTSLSAEVFYDCTGLAEVHIPDSVTKLAEYAFSQSSGVTIYAHEGSAALEYAQTYSISYVEADHVYDAEETCIYCGETDVFIRGTCGDNAKWALNEETGVLIISGTGPMDDYTAFAAPWYTYRNKITSVVVDEGITYIGAYTFWKHTNLASVTFPTTLESIGDYAFEGCSALGPKLTFPDGLVSIGNRAFYDCDGLVQELTFPDSLVSIGDTAFYDCDGLAQILVFPNNLETIGNRAFAYSAGITGVQFGAKLTTIGEGAFQSTSLAGTLEIPETITQLGSSAFASTAITDVVWPDTLTKVPYSLFSGCKSLTNIDFLSGVTEIGGNAFDRCISLTGTLVIPGNVAIVGHYAFRGCTGFTGLQIENGVTAINEYAFSGCSGITGSLVIPDSVQTIGTNAFANMTGITEVSFGSGLVNMGSSYFPEAKYSVLYGCSGVKSVSFHSVDAPVCYSNPFVSMTDLETVYVPGDNFASYAALLALLPETVTVLTDGEKLAVTGLTVSRTYSKTAVLTWDAHFCADQVESYAVFRDGVQIGTATECMYADRSLEPGKSYVYTVCANLTGETQSVHSDTVTAVTVSPQILDIRTEVAVNDVPKLAKESSTLYISVPLGSNLDPLGSQVTSVAVYCGGNLIGYAARNAELDTENAAVYTVCWDLTMVDDGAYDIKAVITDVDGATAEYSETVAVDNTAPAQLQMLAVSTEQTVGLSWTMATEIDTVGYRIYRMVNADGTFGLLTQIDGRSVQSYTDSDVTDENIYYYYVVGVDVFGREGEPSETAGATLVADTVAPKVTKLTPASGSYVTGTVTFAMKAEDNVAVTRTELYYSADQGNEWILLAQMDNGMVSGTLDTTGLADAQLLVKALAYDAAGNVSDGFTQNYMVDNTGPEQVTGLSYVATSVTLTLSWADVADEDIGGFRVEQKNADGTYRVVNSSVTALGLNISGLTPSTAYTYRVIAYDIHGNAGLPSEDLVATTTADAAGPVITQILPASGRYSSQIQVSATVQDEYCVSSVTLQYSTDNITWKDIHKETYTDIQAVRRISAELSLAEVDEGYVYIRAIAEDNEGNLSQNEPLVQHRVDKTGPAAPANVTATGADGYIEISWESTASDVAGFALYRAESETDGFTLVTELTTLNYFDRNVETEKTYFYQVKAKDSAGNWSDLSVVVSAASLTDGEAPTIYSIYPSNGSVIGTSNATVSVLAADNGDLDTMTVQYSHDGENWHALSELTGINTYSTIAAGQIPMAEFSHGDMVYIRALATDISGNSVQSDMNSYIIDLEAPTVLTLKASYAAGCVVLNWTGSDEADLAGYRIYRKLPGGSYTLVNQLYGEAGKTAYSYVDESIPSDGGIYIYCVEAVDNVNNSVRLESEQVTVPVVSTPKAVITCDVTMVAGVEYVLDATASTDNSRIVSYLFSFGDGTADSTEKKTVHVYEEVGEYIITLTVTDDEGNTHTTTQKVVVKTADLAGTARIRIVDENGAPVPGAPVYFDLGEESQVIRETDSSGYATFTAAVGSHTVGCVIANNEWLPVKKDIIITAASQTEVSMTLVNKPIVEGTFEIKRMTLDEIKAAGIDITAPENQYYVEVHLKLQYDNLEIETNMIAGPGGTSGAPIIVYAGGGGNGTSTDNSQGGSGSDGRIIFPTALRSYGFSEEVAVALLDIPIGVSTLKEFFDVNLHVINNASSEFSMLDNVITLNVPDGLTLMDTYNTDDQTVKIAEIKGQTSETIEWLLRGDAVGDYYLDADYSGVLSEFNEPITTKFQATEPIEVYGMTNLKLVLDVAQELDKGTLYYNVSLVNEGQIDVYRPAITTADVLIEMELFDATNAAKAAYYDFDVESIEKYNLSTNLSTLPDVLNPGDWLTLHYMNVDDTTYTECRMKLSSILAEYENTYGLEVEIKERPISFFLANLSTSVNAYDKALETFSYDGSRGAYEYIMSDANFAYWCMANDKEGMSISGDGAEVLFELMSADWADALGKDDKEQARAMILKVLNLASMDNAFSSYANVLNWIALFQSVINGKIPGTQVTAEDAEYLGLALEEIEQNRKWQLYVAINSVSYQASDDVIIDAWIETITDALGVAPPREELREKLHQIYGSEVFQYVWDEYGFKPDAVELIADVASDVASDISIYLAAQSDVNTYQFYLEQLIQYLGTDADSRFLRDAATDIQTAIDSGSIVLSVVKNTMEEGFWALLENGVDAALKKAPIVAVVMKTLEITADMMDLLFNINKRQDVANNIRFVDAIDDAVKKSVKAWRTVYLGSGTNYSAEKYMMMISLLLDTRAVGESQAAQYGVTYETGLLPLGSAMLFRAAADYTGAPGTVETWYQWRDYVEDKLSRCRIELLKNPVATNVNEKTAPTVIFDYTAGQTIQTFSDEYHYSLNGGATWTDCDGSAISVPASMNATELRVKRKSTLNTSETLTAVVPIYGPAELNYSGITAKRTADGYRIENLDNDEVYQVTFSDTALDMDYGSELSLIIPAGSYSYGYTTENACDYIYIRTAASADHYASYIYQVPVIPMQYLTVEIQGTGYVSVESGCREYGEEVTLVVAELEEDWLFQGWYAEDVQVGTELSYTLEMTEDKTVTAKFLQISLQTDGAKLDDARDQATGFGANTTAEEITAYYEALGLTAVVTTASGGEITEGYVGTGSIISVGGKAFTMMISGDVNGDGEIDIADVDGLLSHIYEETTLTGAYYDAGNVAGGEDIMLFDVMKLLKRINEAE